MHKPRLPLSLISLLLLFASCTTTVRVTSQKALDESIAQCNEKLSRAGFQMTGTSVDDKNDIQVTGVSYTPQSGYGTALENNYSVSESYSFATEDGRTLSYSISYKPHADDVRCVTDVAVTGCNVSDSKDFERYCGEVAKISKLPKDLQVHERDTPSTIIAVVLIMGFIGAFGAIIYHIS